MGKIGYGYGSEWHLLWYLGRHRTALDERVRSVAGATSVDWLDFPSVQRPGKVIDGEWKGLEFIAEPEIQADWRNFWPQGAGIPNWDAVGRVRVGGHDEWLLVEAKARRAELGSSCAAKAEGGLDKIRHALDLTKRALGVDPWRDWLNGYYQFCNRLAVLHFLESRPPR